jgi:purine-nucleoside phosphorylase
VQAKRKTSHVQTPRARRSSAPEAAAKILGQASRLRPRLAFVLGSGFHRVAACVENAVTVPYAELPGFPEVTVEGHAGHAIVGTLVQTPVILLAGRAHYYEGHDLDTVTFGVRVLAACGVQDLLLTNAAGGINPRMKPGEFMVLFDHINFMGATPLRGPAAPGQPRFVDLTHAYEPALMRLLLKAGRISGVVVRQGVYLAVSGPNYETPAEIRAFARLGADAIGMSTVPEVIVARQCGIRTAGLSCITNRAAGLGGGRLSHQEVLETAENAGGRACKLLEAFAALYGAG